MAMLNNQMVHVDKSSGTMEHMGWKLTSFNTSKNEEYIYMKMLGEWDGLRDEVYHMTGLSFHHDSQPQDTFFLAASYGEDSPRNFHHRRDGVDDLRSV